MNVNLSNVSYSGPNPDLQTLQANQPGIVDVSFQFLPGETLSPAFNRHRAVYDLIFREHYNEPFQKPASIALAGLGGLTLLLFRRQRK